MVATVALLITGGADLEIAQLSTVSLAVIKALAITTVLRHIIPFEQQLSAFLGPRKFARKCLRKFSRGIQIKDNVTRSVEHTAIQMKPNVQDFAKRGEAFADEVSEDSRFLEREVVDMDPPDFGISGEARITFDGRGFVHFKTTGNQSLVHIRLGAPAGFDERALQILASLE